MPFPAIVLARHVPLEGATKPCHASAENGSGSTPGLPRAGWVGTVSLTVWFGADTADFPEGGGYLWAYMSWALGLRSLGCRVVWLEPCEAGASADEVGALVRSLRRRLEPYGLADEIAVCPRSDRLEAAPSEPESCVALETAREADLFLNVSYNEHRARGGGRFTGGYAVDAANAGSAGATAHSTEIVAAAKSVRGGRRALILERRSPTPCCNRPEVHAGPAHRPGGVSRVLPEPADYAQRSLHRSRPD